MVQCIAIARHNLRELWKAPIDIHEEVHWDAKLVHTEAHSWAQADRGSKHGAHTKDTHITKAAQLAEVEVEAEAFSTKVARQ